MSNEDNKLKPLLNFKLQLLYDKDFISTFELEYNVMNA
jgi:hypothetical protein